MSPCAVGKGGEKDAEGFEQRLYMKGLVGCIVDGRDVSNQEPEMRVD